MGGLFVFFQLFRGFETIDLRHDYIHQNAVRTFSACKFNGLPTVFGLESVIAQPPAQIPQYQQIEGLIVNNENLFCFGHQFGSDACKSACKGSQLNWLKKQPILLTWE